MPAGFKICNSTIVKCKHRPTPPWDLTVTLANFSVLSHPVKEEIAALICSECKPFPAIAHYTGSMHIEIDWFKGEGEDGAKTGREARNWLETGREIAGRRDAVDLCGPSADTRMTCVAWNHGQAHATFRKHSYRETAGVKFLRHWFIGSARIVYMRRRVCETVRCRPMVWSSTGTQQQTRCCRFAAVGPAGRRYRSIAAAAVWRAVPRCQRT